MEKKIIVTKRFSNNTLNIYQYLLKEFSAKIATVFLLRLEKELTSLRRILKSVKFLKKERISGAFYLSLTIRFFIVIKRIQLRYFVFLI